MTAMIDTTAARLPDPHPDHRVGRGQFVAKPCSLPDAQPPKGKDHRVAENRYSEMALPGSLKGIGEDRVASGRLHENVTDIEAEERLAIQHETELAVRQTIPQHKMVAGLLRVAVAIR